MNNQSEIVVNETLEQIRTHKIGLLPSGFQTPALKLTFRQRFYQTNYERQIIRSNLSSNVTRISMPNRLKYIVCYQSELQLVEIKEDKLSAITIPEFAGLVIPLKQRKNPKIVQCYMLDMQNKLYQLELDLINEQEPMFPKFEPTTNLISESIKNVIIKQWILSFDETQFLLVSDKNIYIIDLIEEKCMKIKNPLYLAHSDKPLIQMSECNNSIIMGNQQQLFVYHHSNKKWKQFYIKEKIIQICLLKEVLFIFTQTEIVKLSNIYNDLIDICNNDYVNLEKTIKYAQIDKEDGKLSVVISQQNEVLLLHLSDLDNKNIKIDKLDQLEDYKNIQLIEFEKQQSSMTIRILYFTNDDHLKMDTYQTNI